MTAIAQLKRHLEISGTEQQRCTRDMITKKQKEDLKLQSVPSIIPSVEMFAVPPREEKSIRSHVQKIILDNLKYPSMPKRYESVVDAHPMTFEWAFKDSVSDSYRWANLGTWLKTGNGLYWISGKPGSGKSTLMKYIYDDNRLRHYLNTWAQKGEATPVSLLIGTFFFWNSGNLEQGSQIGMLRGLLFQILEQELQLIPVIFPALWAKEYGNFLAVGPTRGIYNRSFLG